MNALAQSRPGKGLNLALWVVQVLLAVLFFMAGGFKLATPGPELAAAGMNASPMLLKVAGAAEVLGALGLILPSVTRIQPRLTPVAAALLAVVMVLAVITHVVLGEMGAIGGPLVFGVLCSFVAWGRFTRVPIAPK